MGQANRKLGGLKFNPTESPLAFTSATIPQESSALGPRLMARSKSAEEIDYFNRYPLWGTKGKDFKDWEKIYKLIISKEHLTESGRTMIKSIESNMNSKRFK